MTSSKARRDLHAPLPPAPPAAPKGASVYSRFIPSEEISQFAAWTPGSFSDAPAPQRGVIHPAAAAALAAQAAAEAAAQAAQAAEHLAAASAPKPSTAEVLAEATHAARQGGYQDGYRDGMAALESFKKTFATQMAAQIGALMASVGDELDALQQDIARTLAVTATHLARQIVRSELVTRPEQVVQVATETIDTLLLSARHITLRVHPDDQTLVAQGAGELLSARGVRLIGDDSILRGGCLVESDIGVVDATLQSRWRRSAAQLGCDEAWDAPDPADAAVPDGDPPHHGGHIAVDDDDF
jgi:flagellar assembly protein FliH